MCRLRPASPSCGNRSTCARSCEMDNIPFANKPIKAAYMWRDVERRAAMYGLNPKLPAPYPIKELELANRVAIVAAEEGWIEAYAQAAYRHWFEAGEPAGSEPN